MDRRSRQEERAWLASGEALAEAHSLRGLVRAGQLSERRVQLAAYLGHPAAMVLAPGVAVDPKKDDAWLDWVGGTARLGGPEAAVRAAIACGALALGRAPEHGDAALAAAIAWVNCPCPAHAREALLASDEGSYEATGDAALAAANATRSDRYDAGFYARSAALNTPRAPDEIVRAVREALVPWALGRADPLLSGALESAEGGPAGRRRGAKPTRGSPPTQPARAKARGKRGTHAKSGGLPELAAFLGHPMSPAGGRAVVPTRRSDLPEWVAQIAEVGGPEAAVRAAIACGAHALQDDSEPTDPALVAAIEWVQCQCVTHERAARAASDSASCAASSNAARAAANNAGTDGFGAGFYAGLSAQNALFDSVEQGVAVIRDALLPWVLGSADPLKARPRRGARQRGGPAQPRKRRSAGGGSKG